MKRLILCQVLLVVCVAASSQTIYKWTDEAGHVHFGDRNDAKGATAATTLNLRKPAPAAEAPGSAPKVAAAAKDGAKAAPPDSPNLQRCLSLARTMADNKDPVPATIRAQSSELLSLCPGTAYECASYRREPDRNNCQAVTYQPGGSIVTGRTYN